MDIKLTKLNEFYFNLKLEADIKKKLFSICTGLAIANELKFPENDEDIHEDKTIIDYYKFNLLRIVNIKLSQLNENITFDLELAKEIAYNFYMCKWDLLVNNTNLVYNDKFSLFCLLLGVNIHIDNETEELCDKYKKETFDLIQKIKNYFQS